MSAQRDWAINQDSEGIKIGWRMGHRQGRGVRECTYILQMLYTKPQQVSVRLFKTFYELFAVGATELAHIL